jgi:hypothetical protein
MKQLSLNSIEQIQGGDAWEFFDGVCTAVTSWGFGAALLGSVIPGLWVAQAACIGYAVGRGI